MLKVGMVCVGVGFVKSTHRNDKECTIVADLGTGPFFNVREGRRIEGVRMFEVEWHDGWRNENAMAGVPIACAGYRLRPKKPPAGDANTGELAILNMIRSAPQLTPLTKEPA